uniref:RING-type domain-containing protein n=1 Tax=Glossina brevipalpis TaxID=37001 RepID=A0A1A9WI45_9MUSC
MSFADIICIICAKMIKSSDSVYATINCGHLFHEKCLLKYFSRSQYCPQCQRSCRPRQIYRVYLEFCQHILARSPTACQTNGPEWLYFGASLTPNDNLSFGLKLDADEDGLEAYCARDHADYKWMAASDGEIPDNAFKIGKSMIEVEYGLGYRDMYMARAVYNGRKCYGNLYPSSKMALLHPYGDLEVSANQYEILVRIPKSNKAPINTLNNKHNI